MPRVRILFPRVKVLDTNPLHRHGEREIGPVHQTAAPFDISNRLGRNAHRPIANFDAARGLGVVLAIDSQGFRVVDCAHQFVVNPPFQAVLVPVRGVVVEFRVGVGHGMVPTTVTCGRVPLAKEVGLYLTGVVSDPFPVDLIQVVRLENHTADDAGALGHLDMCFHDAEEDVEVGL